jgi:hypothetical protein
MCVRRVAVPKRKRAIDDMTEPLRRVRDRWFPEADACIGYELPQAIPRPG